MTPHPNANLQRALEVAYPNAPAGSWELVDRREGNGPEIVEWRMPRPRPTPASLETALLLADREERRVAIGLQERMDIESSFGSWSEFIGASVLEPEQQKMVEARKGRVNRRLEEQKIDTMSRTTLSSYRTTSEKGRGK